MKIDPCGFDASLKYKCPKCGDDYWVTLQEAKTPGYIVVCFCGGIIHVKTISSVKLNIKYSNNLEVGGHRLTRDQVRVIGMLRAAGYKSGEAKALVEKHYSQDMDVNDLFARCCINETN